MNTLNKLQAVETLKHGCVAAGFPAVIAVEAGESRNQTWNQSKLVELCTNIDEAIGFEAESVWPVIAQLWDVHGYKGVYDLGVIGVWMDGLGVMLYVSSVSNVEAAV